MVNERWPRGDPGWRFERERERGRIEIFVAQCLSSRSMFFFPYAIFLRGEKVFFSPLFLERVQAFHGSPSWTASRYGTDYANVDSR